MRFALGVLTGFAAAWAASAIWHRIPPFPDLDIDPADVPPVDHDWQNRFASRRGAYTEIPRYRVPPFSPPGGEYR